MANLGLMNDAGDVVVTITADNRQLAADLKEVPNIVKKALKGANIGLPDSAFKSFKTGNDYFKEIKTVVPKVSDSLKTMSGLVERTAKSLGKVSSSSGGLGLPNFEKNFTSINDLFDNPKIVDGSKQLSKSVESISKSFGSVSKSGGFMLPDSAYKSFKTSNDLFNDIAKKSIPKVTDGITNMNKAITKATSNMEKEFGRGTIKFAGWAMSIMFFGMAIERIFTGIYNSSAKTFNEVMHTVYGTVTNFDMLSGSIAYLQFTLGQALDPLVGQLIPIIDAVSNWASQHEKLTGVIVATGIAVGAVFAVGGAAVLALNGFLDLFAKIGIVDLDSKGRIKSIDWESIGKSIQKGIGVVAILWSFVMAKEALDDFKSGKFIDSGLGGLASISTGVGGYLFMMGKKGGGPLIGIGVGLNLLEQDKFFSTIQSVVGLVSAVFLTLVDYIESLFTNGILNGIIHGVELALNTIPGIGPLLGITVGQISKAEGLTTSFDWGKDYMTNYAAAIKGGNDIDNAFASIKQLADIMATTSSGGTYTDKYGDKISGTTVENQYIINMPNGNTSIAYSVSDLSYMLGLIKAQTG